MAKRNLTVQLDDDVIHRAKVAAAKRGTSVSGLVTQELERLVDADERYEDAHRRAERAMGRRAPVAGAAGHATTSTNGDVPSTELVFVDTNVLVYAHDASETVRQPIAQSVLAELWRTRSGALSTQVLQEFYVVATRNSTHPVPPRGPRPRRRLRPMAARAGDVPLILAASQLEERHTLSFWDALIVEAARRSGATRLVTEDLQPAGGSPA